MKKTISIFLLFLASCISQNQFAYPSTRRECINLLTKKIVLNIPTPVYLKKENYEEGVIYTYIFKDGGCILIHEGALMQFDLVVSDYTIVMYIKIIDRNMKRYLEQ